MFMGLPDRWDTCSRTIHLEEAPLAFAHCGDTIAVGVGSNVVLLDGIAGVRTSVLSNHTDTISYLASSLDGTMLLSRSRDHILKLWDVQTGGVIGTFGPDASICSASISPDGTTIAFGTQYGEVRLWDVRTWKCRSMIEPCRGYEVDTIEFSPIDPRRLLLSSHDGTACQWDVDGNPIGAPYYGDGVDGHAYASDGTRFVSWRNMRVMVLDSKYGAVVAQFVVPGAWKIEQCCFSPDGRFVACAAGIAIHVWDITISEPRLVGHVEHSDSITFIAFSPFLISGSTNRSVKFWQKQQLSGGIVNRFNNDRVRQSVR